MESIASCQSTETVRHQPSAYALPVRVTDQRTACSTRRSADIRGLHDKIAGRPQHGLHSFIPDMLLYVLAMQIKWSDPQKFRNLILRPGVMHIVKNGCGCIGHPVTGSCIATLNGAAFVGVNSIMDQGKPRVRAMRSFRMASSILLHSFLQTGFRTWEEMRVPGDGTPASYWSSLGRQRHHPTLLVHQLVRFEREGDWLIQQLCIKRLLPYFFVAGHQHYARYLSWHCVEIALLLPAEAKDDLLSGAFFCRQKAGSWNAVSADQFGEQTAIKIGKGGLQCITLSLGQVATSGSILIQYMHTVPTR